MRKTTLLIGIAAGIAVALLAGLGSGGGTASADNGPHVVEAGATPDKCASCHRIHTGQNDYLLKDGGTVEQFCYSCHGNGGPGSDLAAQEGTFYGGTTPGMPYGGKTADDTVGLRAGGFDEARIDTTDPCSRGTPCAPVSYKIGVLAVPETVNSRHSIDGVAGTMWGNGAIGTVGVGPSYTLECTSCHDPHGNGNYRILRDIPQGSGGAGYTIPDTYPKTAADYTTSDYFNMYLRRRFQPARHQPSDGSAAVAGESILCGHVEAGAPVPHPLLGDQVDKPGAEGSRVDSGDASTRTVTRARATAISSHGLPPGSDPVPSATTGRASPATPRTAATRRCRAHSRLRSNGRAAGQLPISPRTTSGPAC